MVYYIHTYKHASGHKQVTRRSVYQVFEREQAFTNLELLGGVLEAVESKITYLPKGTKR